MMKNKADISLPILDSGQIGPERHHFPKGDPRPHEQEHQRATDARAVGELRVSSFIYLLSWPPPFDYMVKSDVNEGIDAGSDAMKRSSHDSDKRSMRRLYLEASGPR